MKFVSYLMALIFMTFMVSCEEQTPDEVAAANNNSTPSPEVAATGPQGSDKQNCGECESGLTECRAKVVLLEQSKDKVAELETTVTTLKTTLSEKEAKIEALLQTPEQKLLSFSERTEKVADLENAQTLRKEMQAFITSNPKTAFAKSAGNQIKSLDARIKQFEKAQAEEAALEAIKGVREMLVGAKDGTDLDLVRILLVSSYIKENNLNFEALKKMPHVNVEEAKKDPESERGKTLTVTGSVIQITKDGEWYTGLMATKKGYGIGQVYNFITPGTTKGIYEGKNGTFTGVFTQMYYYSTRAGGQNDALVLIGYFSGQ